VMDHLSKILKVKHWLNTQIIGQEHLIDRILIALLSDGHLLVEGAPGLAKTKAIKTLAEALIGEFQRIQFTPDLLPSDITGTEVYRAQDGSFQFQKGPVFHNLILADEINRAPAKVQSALLEAMAEKTVSAGNRTLKLPELFLVMATQNPIEQEGTYSLPEAQLDRFLMKVKIDYPDSISEREILRLVRNESAPGSSEKFANPLTESDISAAKRDILGLHMADAVEEYIVALTMATRNPTRYVDSIKNQIDFGVSPRGTISLDLCSRANAYMSGKSFVSPDDVQEVIHDVFRHRLILSFEAEAQGIDPDEVINSIIASVAVA
jgi:MoxR-like ATPase